MCLLDTALIWWTLAPAELSTDAQHACRELDHHTGYLSSISIWEIGLKVKKGHLELPTSIDEYVQRVESIPTLEILPVDVRTWVGNVALDWDHRDPADRTIVATAKILDIPIITSDKRIREFYPKVIW